MRLVILFIPLFLLGCSSLGYERSQNGNTGSPHIVCPDGVKAYLRVTKKMAATGSDGEHLEILCK